MSVAVETGSPRICSGAAASKVRRCSRVTVASSGEPSSSLAMPKSSSFRSDVGRGGDRLSPDLLRGCGIESEALLAGHGGFFGRAFQQLGDAEVEQLPI